MPYSEWFKLDKLSEYHRVIDAQDFMTIIAPKLWPIERRYGFCWLPRQMRQPDQKCEMMMGNPSENFWSELGVNNFTKSVFFEIDFEDYVTWNTEFPADQFPVISMKGAPANYPVREKNRIYQKYMIVSDKINDEVTSVINAKFGQEKFIGIHLRNGEDWSNACSYIDGTTSYMSSTQCYGETNTKILDKELCFPNISTILNDLENLLIHKLNKTVNYVYIATDKNPLIREIRRHFENKLAELNLVHLDPWLPLIDATILARSEHFIGNCVSSFTSYVKRERDIHNRPSSFWAFPD